MKREEVRSFHGPAAVWEEPHFTVSLGNREDEMPQRYPSQKTCLCMNITLDYGV